MPDEFDLNALFPPDARELSVRRDEDGRFFIDDRETDVADVELLGGDPPRVVATVDAAGSKTFDLDAAVAVVLQAPPGFRVVAIRKSERVTEYRVRPA